MCIRDRIYATDHDNLAISWNGGMHGRKKIYGCSIVCNSSYHVFKSGQLQVDGPIITLSALGLSASLFTIVCFNFMLIFKFLDS